MAVTKYYTFGGAIRGENQVGGTGYRAYGPDALGSVCQTYDSTGTLQDTFRYSPCGRSIVSTGSANAPAYLWVGSLGYRNNAREFFEYYIRTRHYSSSLGIWASVDSLWPQEPQYVYVKSNGLTFTDPFGTCRLVRSNPAQRRKMSLRPAALAPPAPQSTSGIRPPQAITPLMLSYNTISKGNGCSCDGYVYPHWYLNWVIKTGSQNTSTSGYIVQRVTWTEKFGCCFLPETLTSYDWWYEAWPVVKGVAINQDKSIIPGSDEDEYGENNEGYHGHVTITFEAYYFPNITEPQHWQPGSGGLASYALMEPPGPPSFWGTSFKSNAVKRNLTESINCCPFAPSCDPQWQG